MKIRVPDALLLLNGVTVLLIVIITFFPSNALRIVLGLPFVLFFPGYTLIAALFPKKNQLDGIERVVLSFGLSIATVPLIGLILNYTPWGVRLYTVLISITIFIVVTSLIVWYRQHRLPKMERFTIPLNLSLIAWRGQRFVDKIVSAILIVAILGAIGTLGYIIATPKVGERFTEFYMLEPEGYPKELVVGEEERVIVGIVNHEYETVDYRIEVRVNEARNNEVGPIVLEHEDRREYEVGFMPVQLGDNQKVEFLLYRQGQSEAYQSLHLWVDVIQPFE